MFSFSVKFEFLFNTQQLKGGKCAAQLVKNAKILLGLFQKPNVIQDVMKIQQEFSSLNINKKD